jgi:hypothetical protein
LELKTLEDFHRLQAGFKVEEAGGIITDSSSSDDEELPGVGARSTAGKSRLNRTMTGGRS